MSYRAEHPAGTITRTNGGDTALAISKQQRLYVIALPLTGHHAAAATGSLPPFFTVCFPKGTV